MTILGKLSVLGGLIEKNVIRMRMEIEMAEKEYEKKGDGKNDDMN